MVLEKPYYKGKEKITIPNSRLKGMLKQKDIQESPISQEQILLNAMESPIGSYRLAQLACDKDKILAITSEHTRPVPNKLTLPIIVKEIEEEKPDAHKNIIRNRCSQSFKRKRNG